MARPEHQASSKCYYDEREAAKYTRNSHIIQVQTELAERAVELLALDPDQNGLILDLGIGSGLCASVVEDTGHCWIGLDSSIHMLEIAVSKQRIADGSCELGSGDVLLADMGDGVPFRPGMFDGAISISALQWMFTVDETGQNPKTRLTRLFTTLYASLSLGARAVFQFYPESHVQITSILEASIKAGFTGGLVVDYPESSKRKKYFLCLMTGVSVGTPLPQPKNQAPSKRQWVLKKKERRRNKGVDSVPRDTKYTGRKRRPKF